MSRAAQQYWAIAGAAVALSFASDVGARVLQLPWYAQVFAVLRWLTVDLGAAAAMAAGAHLAHVWDAFLTRVAPSVAASMNDAVDTLLSGVIAARAFLEGCRVITATYSVVDNLPSVRLHDGAAVFKVLMLIAFLVTIVAPVNIELERLRANIHSDIVATANSPGDRHRRLSVSNQ